MDQHEPVKALETLADFESGQRVIVERVVGRDRVAKRLMEMGIVPGVRVRIVKKAPFGDPIEVRVRGYNLALRVSEAGTVEVSREAG